MDTGKDLFQQLEDQRQQLATALSQIHLELLNNSRNLQRLAETCRQATKSLPSPSGHQFVSVFPFNSANDERASDASPSAASSSETGLSKFWPQSPSDACLDILTHEGIVRQTMVKEQLSNVADKQSIDELVVKMFRSLASLEKWKMMTHFCNVTDGWTKLGPITRWRIEPTVENYLKLPLCYRPTEIQLTTPHWPIIDWNPFPKVRDALIQNRGLYDLTDVCACLAYSFCLESEISKDDGLCSHDREAQGGPQSSLHGFSSGPSVTRAFPDTMFRDSSSTQTSNRQSQKIKKVYYMVQEYVDYQRYPIDHPDKIPPRVDDEAIIQLLLAFRQRENAFKLHPDFFQRFPNLFNDFDVVKGQPRSIYLK